MNASIQFCPNSACIASGLVGAGNIAVHCHKPRWYRCRKCGKTFSERQDTVLFQEVMTGVTYLARSRVS